MSEIKGLESADRISEDIRQISSEGDNSKVAEYEAQKQELQETLEIYRQRARDLVL